MSPFIDLMSSRNRVWRSGFFTAGVTAGFSAPDRAGEAQARGVTVRITESYRDVSQAILAAAAGVTDLGCYSVTPGMAPFKDLFVD